MSDIKFKIESLLKQKGLTQKFFLKKIGMSRQGLYYMLNHNTVKADTLKNIASVLGVPITYFYDDLSSFPGQSVSQIANGNQRNTVIQSIGESECRRELDLARRKIIELQEEIIRLQRGRKG